MQATLLVVIMLMAGGETVTIEALYPNRESCEAQKERLDAEYSEYTYINKYTISCTVAPRG